MQLDLDPPGGEERQDHHVLRDNQQPPLDQYQSSAQMFGVVDRQVGWIIRLRLQAERRVLVSAHHRQRVEGHPPAPTLDTDTEVEQSAGVFPGYQNCEK